MKCFFIALLFSLPAFAAPEATIHPEIDRIVQSYVNRGQFSGVVLVQDGAGTVHYQAYGMAVREHNVPTKLDSSFRIGSLTKQFTAALILHLQEQGQLSVEDPLSKFFSIPDQWKEIKLKHLFPNSSPFRTSGKRSN